MSNTIGSLTGQLDLARMQAEKAVPKTREAKDKAEIKQLANDFESLFVGMVLKSMRETVQKSGLVDGGNAEDIYRSMLDDEYTKMMGAQRMTGLADNIEQYLLQAYETTKPAGDASKAAGLKAYQGQGLQPDAKRATMEDGTAPSSLPVSSRRPVAL